MEKTSEGAEGSTKGYDFEDEGRAKDGVGLVKTKEEIAHSPIFKRLTSLDVSQEHKNRSSAN